MVWEKLFRVFFGLIIFFSGINLPGYAKGSIEIFTLNTEIQPTEDVFVTGFVSTEIFYEPIILEVYDPNGKLLFNPLVNFNDNGQFSWLLHPPLGKYDVIGTYKIIASHKDIPEHDEIYFTVINSDERISDNPIEKLKNESVENPKMFLKSFDFGDKESQNNKQGVPANTPNIGMESLRNSKNDQLWLENVFVFIVPVVIASIVLFYKIKMKTKSNKLNQFDDLSFRGNPL